MPDLYTIEDIARLVTERTGTTCTLDKARAAVRKANLGTLLGRVRILTATDVEPAIEAVMRSRVGKPPRPLPPDV